MTAATTKYPISALPLARKPALLIHALVPDPHTADPAAFRRLQLETPSMQRRARLLQAQSHFSYVSPFPVPFPYAIEPPVPSEPDYIERWLIDREALHPAPPPTGHPDPPLVKYKAKNRDTKLTLIGLSESGLRDCVPHLDVGDAFEVLGGPSLANEFEEEAGSQKVGKNKEGVKAREDLVDVLSGHSALMCVDAADSGKVPFAPWSLRYSGHQFGSFAGQLGDGRAISIHVTPHPSDPELTYELQLKGSGRTPFSRTADGLAVLRSSIREYLCSEAMHALHIPTTRSLSLVSLPEVRVERETTETACVLTRMAPSFLRIGNFEAFNGPTDLFFFGGGQQKPNLDSLRILGEWVAHKVLKLDVEEGEAWGSKLLLEVARRNAVMVAGWQAYGFMHGVMNTDNISVLGLTIDFGPYAFMDVFDPHHICNHTDQTGRYAYKFQPNMIVYAIRALLDALAPLISAETELGGHAVPPGWAEIVSEEKIKEWTKKAKEEWRDEVDRVVQSTAAVEYGRLMRKRLGLRRQDTTDETVLFKPLLNILEEHGLDFHQTFRTLSYFKPSLLSTTAESETPKDTTTTANPALEAFIARLLAPSGAPERLNRDAASSEWKSWLERYAARIESEKDEWVGNANANANGGADVTSTSTTSISIDTSRKHAMLSANPRFILRQWVLEEVIARVEADADSGKRVLAKVMHMCSNPYEPWGGEGDDGIGGGQAEEQLSLEEQAERRYCGLGERKMLGFQCSCSS